MTQLMYINCGSDQFSFFSSQFGPTKDIKKQKKNDIKSRNS